MSNKRYDICTPRKSREGKTFWTRIGTAWHGDKGIQLVFDALPLPDSEGRCVANLFEPREAQSNTTTGQRQVAQPSGFVDAADDLADSVPF